MKMVLIFLLLMFMGCSSNNLVNKTLLEREAIEDMTQEDKIIGDTLPSWVNKSGIENGQSYAVGNAEFSADANPAYVKRAAIMNGEGKLLSDAPTDFRILAQSAMTGAGIDDNEFFEIQTKLKEVVGLSGIYHNQERTTCRKILRYGELSTRLVRSCWVQVSVSTRELSKAYQRTIALKYGGKAANKFGKIMEKELDRVDNNRLLKKEEPKSVVKKEQNNRGRNVASLDKKDVSIGKNKEVKEYSKKDKIINSSMMENVQ